MWLKRSILIRLAAALALMFMLVTASSAQFTIKIPKISIPKIKKDNPQPSADGGVDASASYDKETFESIIKDTDEFGGYSVFIDPYLDCYGRKHNIPQATINAWPKFEGGNSEESLAEGQPRLAELETKLKAKMRSFPHTGLRPEENPGLYYEIASQRAEYRQCVLDGKTSAKAAADAEYLDRMSGIFLEELAVARKEVTEYSPTTKIWLVSAKNSEWLDRAISPGWRKEYYEKFRYSPATVAKFDSQLNALAAEAAPKIAAYTASQINKFNLRNPAEERMMRSVMNDVPGLVVHKIGFYQQTWNIETNGLGIPIWRYKTGAIYGRNPNSDHPYCWFWTINIRQDYAGGGTYGSSYAKYMGRDIATCPSK